ncbi:MAG: hypothetical protein AAGC55_11210, partial [Myxococcota bacterium]
WMPDHGHGTNTPAAITEMADGDGEYMVTPIDLWMPGYWELTISIDDGAGLADEVVFSTCIEG